MTEAEAKRIALEFVSNQSSEHYSLNFISINRSPRNSKHWSIAFEVRPAGGGVLEGPVFVIVDEDNGNAWFFG
ncbi:hypothetical protein PAALTS15_18923 [Paenibacillus alvei TS-15]|jgi:hypothetical protein|uniref:PepSY domain-containing protein n=1 Tax=Paenibacillus alvei TS-15 TaxID=1117108 RepID=S9SNL4_PAEAL|nr:hypothetical protein [Paenibacillus alvei]EPY05633.1 hypothetical protein PAALTS15_18923 [Paenibacillus alvei TS-15]